MQNSRHSCGKKCELGFAWKWILAHGSARLSSVAISMSLQVMAGFAANRAAFQSATRAAWRPR
jgi:hypothetical protein